MGLFSFSPSRSVTPTHRNRPAKIPHLPYSARKGGGGWFFTTKCQKRDVRARNAVYAVDTDGAAADPLYQPGAATSEACAVPCLIDAASVPLAVTNTACRSYLYCISYLY